MKMAVVHHVVVSFANTFEATAIPAKKTKHTSPMMSVLGGWASRPCSDVGRARRRLFASQPMTNDMTMAQTVHWRAVTHQALSAIVTSPTTLRSHRCQLPRDANIQRWTRASPARPTARRPTYRRLLQPIADGHAPQIRGHECGHWAAPARRTGKRRAGEGYGPRRRSARGRPPTPSRASEAAPPGRWAPEWLCSARR